MSAACSPGGHGDLSFLCVSFSRKIYMFVSLAKLG